MCRRANEAMAFLLTDEQELSKASIREFCDKYLEPIAIETDKEARFPAEAFVQPGKLGWLGMPVPPEYGGAGLD